MADLMRFSRGGSNFEMTVKAGNTETETGLPYGDYTVTEQEPPVGIGPGGDVTPVEGPGF